MTAARSRLRAAALVTALLFAGAVAAHQSGNSYLTLSDASGEFVARIDLSITDLDGILQLAPDESAPYTADRLAVIQARLAGIVQQRLIIEADAQPLALAFVSQSVTLRNDGLYLRQIHAAPLPPAAVRDIVIRYNFFDRGGTSARAFARLDIRGRELFSVFDARSAVQRFAVAGQGRLHTLSLFVQEGALHIWSGADHLLFLFCVLLPGLGLIHAGAESRAHRYRPALWFALQVVTAFTVAHSLTLAAAATGWIALPDQWVEVAIALSIMASALLNLMWKRHAWHWRLAFGFGLIHGLGFASGLRELGLAQQHFLESLLAFNVGVELGQCAALGAAGALLLAWPGSDHQRARLIVRGSLLVLPLSAVWLGQRVLA